jgi:hypothetical protein
MGRFSHHPSDSKRISHNPRQTCKLGNGAANALQALRSASASLAPICLLTPPPFGRNRTDDGLPACVDRDMLYVDQPMTAGCSRTRSSSRSTPQSTTTSTESAPSPAGKISSPAAPPLSRSGVNSARPDMGRVWPNRAWFSFVRQAPPVHSGWVEPRSQNDKRSIA